MNSSFFTFKYERALNCELFEFFLAHLSTLAQRQTGLQYNFQQS